MNKIGHMTSWAGRVVLGVLVGLTPGFPAGPGRPAGPQSDDLVYLGPQRVFEGRTLSRVAFPLGGIGTGTVSLGGRGDLRDWEIFNRPGKGIDLPLTFFCAYIRPEGEKPLLRILEGPLEPPFQEAYGHGYPRGEVPGLPRLKKARFTGRYPVAKVEFEDGDVPLEISLEAFNPLIPLDPDESGIPGFVLRYRLKNPTEKRIKLTVVGTVLNPVGFDGTESLDLRTVGGTLRRPCFGRNLNEFRTAGPISGLLMSSRALKPDDPLFGTLALTTTWPRTTHLSHWVRAEWFDDFFAFMNDLLDDGLLESDVEESPSADGATDLGSLGLTADLGPGEVVELPFFLTWHFPNFLNDFDRRREMRGLVYRNRYATRFTDAWAAADHLARNIAGLEAETRKFADVFFRQTLPPYVLEAASSQASTIRTPTCFWLDDGNFFAFEGCNVTTGCCPLNCTHVWNYAQALAWLFPSLERNMRATDFLNNVKPDGEMAFRTTLPLGSGKYWVEGPHPAADGQFGTIIRLYRDWQISGDNSFLKRLWPNAKKALEYAWTEWDKDKRGILTGRQHNTFDIEFYGTSSLTGSLYLGALLAGAEMAEAVGDRGSAVEYRAVYERGSKSLDALTWNGEYYVQKYDEGRQDKYQYGTGCVSDQLLGEWLARIAGLGPVLPEAHVRKALDSIFRLNFRESFHDDYHAMRTFALGDEKGLVNCSWPEGDKPAIPFVYASEVWTGTEYQVASHLILEERIDEGLRIVKAVRDRHDGWKRNPWNEEESGNHYARAMSSWAVLLALSGFEYSGPDNRLGFAPRIFQEEFRSFWSTGTGWGSYAQRLRGDEGDRIVLDADGGRLKLGTFVFRLPACLSNKKVSSVLRVDNGRSEKLSFRQEGQAVRVRWREPLALRAPERLDLIIRY